MVTKRLEATTRFGVKLSPEERVKLVLMSNQMDCSESEVLRTLIVCGIIIEKPVNNLLLEISENISRMRSEINNLSSNVLAKNHELAGRLQELEDVLVGEIVERQPVETLEKIEQKSPPQLKEIPTLEEFKRGYKVPMMPSQLATFNQEITEEYFKKFGVMPTE